MMFALGQALLECKVPHLKQNRSMQRTSDRPNPLVHSEVGSKRKSLFVPEPELPAVSSKQAFTSNDSSAFRLIKPVAKMEDGVTGDPLFANHDRANVAAKLLLKRAEKCREFNPHDIALLQHSVKLELWNLPQ